MVNILDTNDLSNYITSTSQSTVPIVSIGRLIKDELHRQERTVTWLSRKIHCDRRNIYDIFTRDNIDTNLLMRISVALSVNLFEPYIIAMQTIDRQGVAPPKKRNRNLDRKFPCKKNTSHIWELSISKSYNHLFL